MLLALIEYSKYRIPGFLCAFELVYYQYSFYYFFTNIANDDGWAINSDLFKVTQNYIRVPKSNGTILDEEEGCIRFNTSTSRYQGYVGGAWVDFH